MRRSSPGSHVGISARLLLALILITLFRTTKIRWRIELDYHELKQDCPKKLDGITPFDAVSLSLAFRLVDNGHKFFVLSATFLACAMRIVHIRTGVRRNQRPRPLA